jgi:diguanylate cyclase (GGDEF)-like protein
VAAAWLRGHAFPPDLVLHGYLQAVTGLLAFVFAAVSLVRFRGTQDRITLILGSGFLLSGAVLTGASLFFFHILPEVPARPLWVPVAWWVSRMLLALLLVVAILVERFLPRSRHPRSEIAGALLTVIGVTYLITAALRHLPPYLSAGWSTLFPSPMQLVPAGVFLLALYAYRRRLVVADTAFDHGLYAAVWLNLAAQLAATQSERLLDAPFTLAQGLTVGSFAVVLGGALLDNARLFERVQHMAATDPLTGLANYRHLLDVLENEIERTNRSARPFAVLLFDLDGLKKINDTYGHLTGSRALCRVANILRFHCRAIDTAARYGGDEFALVLPETQETDAYRVAARIRERMTEDKEKPELSSSIGVAIYRGDGERLEKLLSEADRNLYTEKSRKGQVRKTRATKSLAAGRGS